MIRAAIAFAIGILVIYLIFVFATLGFDVTLWTEDKRGVCAFAGVMFGSALAMITFMHNDK